MKNIFKLVLLGFAAIVVIFLTGKMAVNVDADEIVITQDPFDGDLHIHTTAGIKNQNFGTEVGNYHKSNQYNFDIPEEYQDELNYEDAFTNPQVAQYGIRVRFNDDGDAIIFGSMRYDLPLEESSLEVLQTQFGSRTAIENDIVKRTVNNAVFQVGPLMSSKESSAEKRSDLLFYIEDMALKGAYKTIKRMDKEKDPVTGDIVEVKHVEIVTDSTKPDGYARQVDRSQFERYNIQGGNFTITQIIYSPEVQEQIAQQQKLTMKVQIAKADALKAQQDEITAEADGKSKAATAKWTQEAVNAKEIALAEKDLKVQKLKADKAEAYKREQTLIGEGDAAKKRAVFTADGALKQKLEAYKSVQKDWAEAYSKRPVPQTQFNSGSGSNSGSISEVETFMQLQNAKVLKDLGLNMNVKK